MELSLTLSQIMENAFTSGRWIQLAFAALPATETENIIVATFPIHLLVWPDIFPIGGIPFTTLWADALALAGQRRL